MALRQLAMNKIYYFGVAFQNEVISILKQPNISDWLTLLQNRNRPTTLADKPRYIHLWKIKLQVKFPPQKHDETHEIFCWTLNLKIA